MNAVRLYEDGLKLEEIGTVNLYSATATRSTIPLPGSATAPALSRSK